MEKFLEVTSVIVGLAVFVPLVIILAGWAINVVNIFWVIGDKLEQLIGEKIDKHIYGKQKR